MQRRTLRDGESIDQNKCEDDVEQTQCGQLICSAPCDDVAIVARHVIIVTVVGALLDELLFVETFVRQCSVLREGNFRRLKVL